jgi:hypothetical protein
LIRVVANNIYVTRRDQRRTDWYQNGVTAASAGDTSTRTGAFGENVTVGKVIHSSSPSRLDAVRPPTSAVTTSSPAAATGHLIFNVTMAGSSVDGFAFSGGRRRASDQSNELQHPRSTQPLLLPSGSAIFLNRGGADITIERPGSSIGGSGRHLHERPAGFSGIASP